MRNTVLFVFFILCCFNARSADTLKVCSPSGKICVKVWTGKQLTYQVYYENKSIVDPSFIDLLLDNNRSLSVNNSIKSSSIKKISEQIISPVQEKRKIIPDIYNSLTLSFRQPYK